MNSKVKELFRLINKLFEAMCMAEAEKTISWGNPKSQVNKYFSQLAPHFLVIPIVIFNVLASMFFLGHCYVLGGVLVIMSISLLMWWQIKRGKLKNQMFKEAKNRYRRMEELFKSAKIPMDIFYEAFPNWSSALEYNFNMKALYIFQKCASNFERKKASSNKYNESSEKRYAMEVFGISSCIGMTEDKLKSIYRKLAKQCHPDMHPNNPECEAEFKKLNNAYGVLLKYI